MAIVMFGLNLGASVVPYGTALLWQWHGINRPIVLIIICGLSMLLPLPLLFLSKKVRYQKSITPGNSGRDGVVLRQRSITIHSYETVCINDSRDHDDPGTSSISMYMTRCVL